MGYKPAASEMLVEVFCRCRLSALSLEESGVFAGKLSEGPWLATGQGAHSVAGLLECALSDEPKHPDEVLHEPVRHARLDEALSCCLFGHVDELDGLTRRSRELFDDALVR